MAKLNLHTVYMRRAFESPDLIASKLGKGSLWGSYDTLVGTGLSGSLVIPRAAEALGLVWMIVRKDGDNSHSGLPAEGTLGERWLFVDDTIGTGATYRRVYTAIESLAAEHGHLTAHVGAYLYQGEYYKDSDWIVDRVSPVPLNDPEWKGRVFDSAILRPLTIQVNG